MGTTIVFILFINKNKNKNKKQKYHTVGTVSIEQSEKDANSIPIADKWAIAHFPSLNTHNIYDRICWVGVKQQSLTCKN